MILVPAGTRHNIINGPSGSMKLYTLYAPPNHRDGVVHATKAAAEADKRAFQREDDRIATCPTICSASRPSLSWPHC